MPARVVVLGGRQNVLECAHELGVDVVLIHRDGGYEPAAARITERIVHADLGDQVLLDKIVRSLHADRPLARVLSLTEDGLVPAARLNAALGLGGNSVELLKDKARMRALPGMQEISPVRARMVTGLAGTLGFLAEVGGRAVLKPVDGAGSVHVHPVDAARRAWATLPRFLDLVGLVEGPAHTEVILTAAGPRIVESHNRIGGGRLRELIKLAYGVDFARLAVSVPLGLETGPAGPVPASGGVAVRFFTPEPGVIERIEGADGFAGDPDVSIHLTARPGDPVPPLRTSHDRTTGYVIGRGRDAAEAVARCAAVLAGVRVVTRPTP